MINNRNLLISFLQLFGILLVVVGHSFYGYESKYPIHAWIYTFHMPLFMFISGYLLLYSLQKRNTTVTKIKLKGKNGFILKKIKRLLVPYIVISSIAFFPKMFLNEFAKHPVDASFSFWIQMLIYPWNNVIIFFWFLPTLFLIICIVISFIRARNILKIKLPTYIIIIILLLLHLFNPFLSVNLFNISGVVSYLIYFVLGYFYCKHQEYMNIHIRHSSVSIFLFTFFLSIILLRHEYIGADLLKAINGIIMSISLGYIYVNQKWSFFNFLLGASYTIYLFSWFPQVLSQQVFLKITHAPKEVGTILAIISGIYIPLFIYKWAIKIKNKGKIGKIVALLTGI